MKVKNKLLGKIGLVIIFLIGINYFVLTRDNNGTSTMDKDTIIVGMELKFPPFETVDDKGNPSGVSVELANRIGEKLNKKIVFKSVDYSSLIPALQSNNIDLIISSMGITEERLKSIDFSDEYAKSELALAINKEVDADKYEDLNKDGIIVAVKQGTIGEMWATKNLPNAKIKAFTEVSAALLDVNNGQSSAFIYDPLSLVEGTSNLSNIKLSLASLPGIKGWGVGMRKGEEALKNEINKALEEIKSEGFFNEMRDKYLKEDVEKYESYGLDYLF